MRRMLIAVPTAGVLLAVTTTSAIGGTSARPAAATAHTSCASISSSRLQRMFQRMQDDSIAQENARLHPYCIDVMSASPVQTVHPDTKGPSTASDMKVKVTQFKAAKGSDPKYYGAEFTWKWKNEGYDNEVSKGGENSVENIGGLDSWAVALNSNVEMIHFAAQQCGRRYHGAWMNKQWHCTNFTKPSSSSGNGAGFERQDKEEIVGVGYVDNNPTEPIYKDDENQWSGSELIEFKARHGCLHAVQAYAKFAHTWSSTAVDGIGIGISGDGGDISFDWHDEGHDWVLASQPSNPMRVCHKVK